MSPYVIGFCLGIGLYAAVLGLTHLLVVRLENRRAALRSRFQARVRKYVLKGFIRS